MVLHMKHACGNSAQMVIKYVLVGMELHFVNHVLFEIATSVEFQLSEIKVKFKISRYALNVKVAIF